MPCSPIIREGDSWNSSPKEAGFYHHHVQFALEEATSKMMYLLYFKVYFMPILLFSLHCLLAKDVVVSDVNVAGCECLYYFNMTIFFLLSH